MVATRSQERAARARAAAAAAAATAAATAGAAADGGAIDVDQDTDDAQQGIQNRTAVRRRTPLRQLRSRALARAMLQRLRRRRLAGAPRATGLRRVTMILERLVEKVYAQPGGTQRSVVEAYFRGLMQLSDSQATPSINSKVAEHSAFPWLIEALRQNTRLIPSNVMRRGVPMSLLIFFRDRMHHEFDTANHASSRKLVNTLANQFVMLVSLCHGWRRDFLAATSIDDVDDLYQDNLKNHVDEMEETYRMLDDLAFDRFMLSKPSLSAVFQKFPKSYFPPSRHEELSAIRVQYAKRMLNKGNGNGGYKKKAGGSRTCRKCGEENVKSFKAHFKHCSGKQKEQEKE